MPEDHSDKSTSSVQTNSHQAIYNPTSRQETGGLVNHPGAHETDMHYPFVPTLQPRNQTQTNMTDTPTQHENITEQPTTSGINIQRTPHTSDTAHCIHVCEGKLSEARAQSTNETPGHRRRTQHVTRTRSGTVRGIRNPGETTRGRGKRNVSSWMPTALTHYVANRLRTQDAFNVSFTIGHARSNHQSTSSRKRQPP